MAATPHLRALLALKRPVSLAKPRCALPQGSRSGLTPTYRQIASSAAPKKSWIRRFSTNANKKPYGGGSVRRQFEESRVGREEVEKDDWTSKVEGEATEPSSRPVGRPKIGKYEVVGENEVGQRVLRPVGLNPSLPTKNVEELRTVKQKGGNYRLRERVVVQRPLKDKDFDFLVAKNEKLEAPFDFSKLSSRANDVALIFEELESRLKLPIQKHRDAAIQAFESFVKNQAVKAMDPSLFTIGKELIELHVHHALTATYPNLPHKALIHYVQMATSREFLARSLLSLKLEPYIQIVPSIPLSKFPDPSTTCLDLGANAFCSLIGVVYLEHGFDKASELVFSSIDLPSVTPEELRKFDLLDGVQDSKIHLHSLLYQLRFPLPAYEIESVTSQPLPTGDFGKRYTAIVRSGHKIIGRGQANTKLLAERRAAAEAILNHWAQQSPL